MPYSCLAAIWPMAASCGQPTPNPPQPLPLLAASIREIPVLPTLPVGITSLEVDTGFAPGVIISDQLDLRDAPLSVPPASVRLSLPAHAQEWVASLPLPQVRPERPLVVPKLPAQVRPERSQGVSLTEVLELAGRTNRTIQDARIAVARLQAEVRESESARSPSITARLDYTFNDSASARLSNIASPPGISRDTISQPLNGSLQLDYNIFSAGGVDANIRVQESRLRIAETELNRVTQQVRLEVVTAYYTLQNADETLRIRQKQVENAEQSLRDTQALERAGVGTKFDVLQSEVQLANARQELLNAQSAQLIARRDLARILDFAPTVELTAADKIEPVVPWRLGVEDSIILAVRNRAELDRRRLERQVAQDRAIAAISTIQPQVNLFATLDLLDDFSTIGGIASGYRLGARLEWRLFDGGRVQAQVDQFTSDAQLAENQFESAARQIRFEVEQSFLTAQSRRQQIDTARIAQQQAIEALRLARLRLSAGVGTQTEVIQAERDVTQAEVNLLQAVIGFNQAIANLERATSGL
ncbi:MAG: TolC family protein [Oscillatoriales cyanobacterium SM2_2_1]|nr:TolC family protein [Oscillatoriales cyanobacterium SM2_2_1]